MVALFDSRIGERNPSLPQCTSFSTSPLSHIAEACVKPTLQSQLQTDHPTTERTGDVFLERLSRRFGFL